jgi:hypothetical protein
MKPARFYQKEFLIPPLTDLFFMKQAAFLVLCIGTFLGSLTSCAIPQNQASVMNGKVRGGHVPLYVMGYSLDFVKAGILQPKKNDYLRTYYDVMDITANGKLRPAYDSKKSTSASVVAQVAIPSLFSSYDLPSGYEAKYALPVHEESQVFNLSAASEKQQPTQIFTDAALWSSLNYQVASTTIAASEAQYPRATIVGAPESPPRAMIVKES